MIPTTQPDYTAHWEGFVPHAYLCPSGFLTIGYGHRLATPDLRDIPGLNARLAASKDQWMPEPLARIVLKWDLGRCAERLASLLGVEAWRALVGTPREVVLLDWCLNTGGGSMPGFRESVRSAALMTEDPLRQKAWAMAHDELLLREVGQPEPSAYAKVRLERAELNAKVILTGEWPA